MLGLMVNDPALKAAQLAGIEAETLVIAGTKDMIRDSHTRLIARSLPHSRLEIIEGDHFIAANRHEEFNRIVLDFLKN